MNASVDISAKALEELKALAYDCLARIQAEQNNLQVLNVEIANRSQGVPAVLPVADEAAQDVQ